MTNQTLNSDNPEHWNALFGAVTLLKNGDEDGSRQVLLDLTNELEASGVRRMDAFHSVSRSFRELAFANISDPEVLAKLKPVEKS